MSDEFGHYADKDGVTYFDTNAVQLAVSKWHGDHLGFGDFVVKTPEGDIRFTRQDSSMERKTSAQGWYYYISPEFKGRPHTIDQAYLRPYLIMQLNLKPVAEGNPRALRPLTSAEIEMYASRAGVRRIAVENFLGTLEGLTYEEAMANLQMDTQSYRWNAATYNSIRAGIVKASSESNPAYVCPDCRQRFTDPNELYQHKKNTGHSINLANMGAYMENPKGYDAEKEWKKHKLSFIDDYPNYKWTAESNWLSLDDNTQELFEMWWGLHHGFYRQIKTNPTKTEATKKAESMRRKGLRARVIKTGEGREDYSIYADGIRKDAKGKVLAKAREAVRKFKPVAVGKHTVTMFSKWGEGFNKVTIDTKGLATVYMPKKEKDKDWDGKTYEKFDTKEYPSQAEAIKHFSKEAYAITSGVRKIPKVPKSAIPKKPKTVPKGVKKPGKGYETVDATNLFRISKMYKQMGRKRLSSKTQESYINMQDAGKLTEFSVVDASHVAMLKANTPLKWNYGKEPATIDNDKLYEELQKIKRGILHFKPDFKDDKLYLLHFIHQESGAEFDVYSLDSHSPPKLPNFNLPAVFTLTSQQIEDLDVFMKAAKTSYDHLTMTIDQNGTFTVECKGETTSQKKSISVSLKSFTPPNMKEYNEAGDTIGVITYYKSMFPLDYLSDFISALKGKSENVTMSMATDYPLKVDWVENDPIAGEFLMTYIVAPRVETEDNPTKTEASKKAEGIRKKGLRARVFKTGKGRDDYLVYTDGIRKDAKGKVLIKARAEIKRKLKPVAVREPPAKVPKVPKPIPAAVEKAKKPSADYTSVDATNLYRIMRMFTKFNDELHFKPDDSHFKPDDSKNTVFINVDTAHVCMVTTDTPLKWNYGTLPAGNEMLTLDASILFEKLKVLKKGVLHFKAIGKENVEGSEYSRLHFIHQDSGTEFDVPLLDVGKSLPKVPALNLKATFNLTGKDVDTINEFINEAKKQYENISFEINESGQLKLQAIKPSKTYETPPEQKKELTVAIKSMTPKATYKSNFPLYYLSLFFSALKGKSENITVSMDTDYPMKVEWIEKDPIAGDFKMAFMQAPSVEME